MFPNSRGWLPIWLKDQPVGHENDQDDPLIEKHMLSVKRHKIEYVYLFLIIGFSLSLVLNAYMLASVGLRLDLDKACSIFTSQHRSPLEKQVAIKYSPVLFNGSIFKETIFRKAASSEVDEAWMSLGTDYRPVVIPEHEAESYGLSPNNYVKRREDHGGGVIAYVEVLHHLHCLNLLRKASFFSYQHYHNEGKDAFSNNEEVLRLHFGHCLDILRQQIMCTADFTVFGELWVKDQSAPSPDFNRRHKCKNFEEIRSWAERNQMAEFEKNTPEYEYRADDSILPEVP